MGKKRGAQVQAFLRTPFLTAGSNPGEGLLSLSTPISQAQTAMQQERALRVSNKRSQEVGTPGTKQLQSDPDSETPLVSLIWPQTHSFFHSPAPHWGKVEKG